MLKLGMDVVSDILGTLKLHGSLYFRTEFRAPWSVRVPVERDVVRFHLVASGDCWVTVGGRAEPIALTTGDFIVIPHGADQVLSDEQGRPPEALDDVLRAAEFTGEGPLRLGPVEGTRVAKIVCGFCEFDSGADHPLMRSLPGYILIRGVDAMAYSWLAEALRFLTYEAHSDNLGQSAVVDRLAEILFIQAVRVHSESAGHEAGYFAGLADPPIYRALSAMHLQPERPWTLPILAKEVGLSRSLLSERFRHLVGQPPMQYLTEWRLQKARQMIAESGISIEQVAWRVGYQSLPSFSRLFKRHFGVSPGRYRRSNTTETDPAT